MPKGWSSPLAKVAIWAALPLAAVPQDDDLAGTGVGEEEIAIRGKADQAWLSKGATAAGHVLHIVGALHGGSVAAGVKCHLEAGRGDGPCVRRSRDDMGAVVGGFRRPGLGEVGDGDLAADTGLLLVVAGECGLAGDGLLGWECCGEKEGGGDENG